MTVKAVIWDVGGVLLRTVDPNPRQQLADRLGIQRRELEKLVFFGESGKLCQLGVKSYEQHLHDVLATLGLPADQFGRFEQEFWGGDRIDDDLVKLIRELHQDSCKIGLLSNAFSNMRGLLSLDWQIVDIFDAIVISAEVGIVKPDPRIYQLTVDALAVAPEQAVFIDDFIENIEAARDLSLQTIYFKSPEQARSELNLLLNDQK